MIAQRRHRRAPWRSTASGAPNGDGDDWGSQREVSATIFAAIAGLAVGADDVRRVPLADPPLLEFLEGSDRVFPGPAASLSASMALTASRISALREQPCAFACRSTSFKNSSGSDTV